MILHGDCLAQLKTLPDSSVQCCVTSPPYWGLRDYGVEGQIGMEATPDAYVQKMVQVFREVKRVLKDNGTCWLNLGDSYASSGTSGNQRLDKLGDKLGEKLGCGGGHKHSNQLCGRAPTPDGLKPKDLVGIPWRVAFALQADGWYLRSDIIWHKPNPMPESVTDRPTKSHEYIFLLTKSERYFYDHEAIAEMSVYPGDNRALRSDTRKQIDPMCIDGGSRARTGQPTSETRNKRTVWTIATQPYPEAHFATFPPKLIEPCILAGSRPGDTVIDPFAGSGTTLYVAKELNRQFIGIELNPAYVNLIHSRLAQEVLNL